MGVLAVRMWEGLGTSSQVKVAFAQNRIADPWEQDREAGVPVELVDACSSLLLFSQYSKAKGLR